MLDGFGLAGQPCISIEHRLNKYMMIINNCYLFYNYCMLVVCTNTSMHGLRFNLILSGVVKIFLHKMNKLMT